MAQSGCRATCEPRERIRWLDDALGRSVRVNIVELRVHPLHSPRIRANCDGGCLTVADVAIFSTRLKPGVELWIGNHLGVLVACNLRLALLLRLRKMQRAAGIACARLPQTGISKARND